MTDEAFELLSSIPPVLDRYELKYVIPTDLVEPISDFVSFYCALDSHSRNQPNHFYPVNSLYFDTPNYRFLKLRMNGAERRFNMRVRAYGLEGRGPYFAEIKYRVPTSVKKFRCMVEEAEWPGFLNAPILPVSESSGAREASNRALFQRIAQVYAIEPKIFTCYHRRAFVSEMDDYARVTFDINMRYRSQNLLASNVPWCLAPGDECINYDVETIYGDEARFAENVILELKANVGAIPLWMMELIRRFQLKRVGFSKYLNSSMAEHFEHAPDYMTLDRKNGVRSNLS